MKKKTKIILFSILAALLLILTCFVSLIIYVLSPFSVPGDTSANYVLLQDVIKGIGYYELANGGSAYPKVINTKQITKGLNGIKELWTVDRNGKSIVYTVDLIPDGMGGTYIKVNQGAKKTTQFANSSAKPEKPILPPTTTQIQCWQNYRIAQQYISDGDWKQGEEYCYKALNSLKDTDPDHAHGAMRNNIVRPLIMNGKIDKAQEMALSALEYNKKTKDNIGIAVSYMNLGDVYKEKDDIAKRDEYWQKGYDIAKGTNDLSLIAAMEDRIKSKKQK